MSHPAGCQCGDADAHVLLDGQLNFLYPYIDRDRVVALNGEEGKEGKMVIRPWDERNQEGASKTALSFLFLSSL